VTWRVRLPCNVWPVPLLPGPGLLAGWLVVETLGHLKAAITASPSACLGRINASTVSRRRRLRQHTHAGSPWPLRASQSLGPRRSDRSLFMPLGTAHLGPLAVEAQETACCLDLPELGTSDWQDAGRWAAGIGCAQEEAWHVLPEGVQGERDAQRSAFLSLQSLSTPPRAWAACDAAVTHAKAARPAPAETRCWALARKRRAGWATQSDRRAPSVAGSAPRQARQPTPGTGRT